MDGVSQRLEEVGRRLEDKLSSLRKDLLEVVANNPQLADLKKKMDEIKDNIKDSHAWHHLQEQLKNVKLAVWVLVGLVALLALAWVVLTMVPYAKEIKRYLDCARNKSCSVLWSLFLSNFNQLQL